MLMNREPEPYTTHRIVGARAMCLVFCVLALAAGLILISSRPARGRWEVPQIVEPVEGDHSSPSKAVVPPAIPTRLAAT